MIIEEVAYARAGLVGNPSDIFHGKTMSLLFDRFKAVVKLYESPQLKIVPNPRDSTTFDSLEDLVSYRKLYGYYGGIRLIEAIIVRFRDYCRQQDLRLDDRNFAIEYHSTIPFSVGLGGSSSIIKAVFSALLRFYGLTEQDIPKPIQPNILLEAETDELGISAGPQDRVVVVYGGLVHMDFTNEAYAQNGGVHGTYENLAPGLLPPLFIAYKEELSKSSGAIHNIMRYRASVEHDPKVLEVMRKKATLVDDARAQLLAGNKHALGPILTEDFDLRQSVYDISPANRKMITIARELGSHAKQTGPGGATIGTYKSEEHFFKLEEAYRRHGCSTLRVNVVEYP